MNLATQLRLESPATGNTAPAKQREADIAIRRRRALKRVDRELTKGNFKTALSLVKQLQGKPGGLRGFGAAKQVPKKQSTLDNLEFNGINLTSLRLLVDSVCGSIETCILQQQVLSKKIVSVINNEGIHSSFEDYHFLCAQHEAGHFLVGYLLGALPEDYKVPSTEELRNEHYAVGRVRFVGFEFLQEVGAAKVLEKNIIKGEVCDRVIFSLFVHGINEQAATTYLLQVLHFLIVQPCHHMIFLDVNRGEISSKTLNRFSCIILGGLVAEHLVFGYSEGLHADVDKLNTVLKWLGFTESESNFQMRWAALNTIYILHRHREATSRLVEAMTSGRSVGFCIDTIENAIHGKEI